MTATKRSGSEASSDPIRFVLDGEVETVRGIDPNTTVLSYLRETLRRTGTKEGCAEGDCGACTVVLGELDGDRVRFRAINSCIQLVPTLDGKELFTVESLKRPDGDAPPEAGKRNLHAAPQASVASHGAQCGFCTSGIG
ncbi:MAG: 2Fe-2S iron-sulfur cluster binding domain-containing protein, partial [bacterium]|nr:2Fe-2S iron-sulfur cluster binding domain-containing protein [bacterium]